MDVNNPGPKPTSGGGGRNTGKPEPAERMGSSDFANESNLAGGNGSGAGGGANSDGGPSKAQGLKDKAKSKAAGASETANDIKDIAKAGPGGVKSAADEIKQGAEKDGAKGAVAAAGREAVGQGAAKAATVATGGALAPIAGQIGKAISKGLKKENLKKIGYSLIVLIGLPLIILGFIAGVIFYAAANPIKFVQQVLTDPKAREFAVQAASLAGKTIVGSEDVLKKYGYVEYKEGTAIAQNNAPQPKPGSLEEKITKINFRNASYQTTKMPDCPYVFSYKTMISNGKSTTVIDKVYDKNGNLINDKGFLYGYCLVQTMPLYNMMVRTQSARNINKFSNTALNYADSKDSPNLKGKSNQQLNDYVYQKTYKRITSQNDQTPKVSGYASLNKDPAKGGIDKYIQDVRKALEANENPDAITFPIKNVDTNSTAGSGEVAKSLCAFSDGYLTQQNIKKAIGSRLNSGQRSGIKWNTLSSTREVGDVSTPETEASFRQLDGWTSSTAYSQNLYGTFNGAAVNPESLGNTSYSANYAETISLLLGLKKQCSDVENSDTFLNNVIQFVSFGNAGISKDEAKLNILKIYRALQDLIIKDSNGKFKERKDFGLEQLIISVVRTGGGSAVSGLEQGPQNFNNQSQGFRAIANQYMMQIGGQFLTAQESLKLNTLSENTRIQLEKKNGIAYRLFGEENIRSIANIARYESPRTPNEISTKAKQYIAYIANPIKLIADTQSTIGYIGSGSRNVAFAASGVGDAYMKLDTVGIPEALFENTDVYEVSNEIQDIKEKGSEDQKKVLGYFDKCSKANIPTANYFIRGYKPDYNGEKVNLIKNQPWKIEIDGKNGKVNVPKYPATGEGGDGDDSQPNFTELGFSDRTEYMACEIYLLPNRPETINDLNGDVQTKIFGLNINDLAKKYHIYLYANGIVDLMVELSDTEKTDKIYANGSSGAAQSNASTSGVVGDIGESSESVACPEGTKDLGVADSKYSGAAKKTDGQLKIRLCQIPEIPGDGDDASGNNLSDGAVVNSRVAGAFLSLAKAAKAEGVNLSSNSSFRLADSCNGTGDGSACARPGQSPHQLGIAIDFKDMGLKGSSTTDCSGRARLPESPQWSWMFKNAERFGIEQYTFEAWHWDLLGGANRCNSAE